MMDGIRNLALEEQAVETVLAKAKVTDKETGFTDLMNQQALGSIILSLCERPKAVYLIEPRCCAFFCDNIP
ncbi:hypothetical protein ACNKHW_02505 [Shigella flexneri]